MLCVVFSVFELHKITCSFGSSSKEDDGKRSELVKLDAKE